MGITYRFLGWTDDDNLVSGTPRSLDADGRIVSKPYDPGQDVVTFTLPHPAPATLVELYGGSEELLRAVSRCLFGPAFLPRGLAAELLGDETVTRLLNSGHLAFYPEPAGPDPDLVLIGEQARRLMAEASVPGSLLALDLTEAASVRTDQQPSV